MASLKPYVRIYDNLDVLSLAAAAVFVEASEEAVSGRGRFLVAVSGGTTPVPLYELLAKAPYRAQVDWSLTHVFWGDERCVPAEDLQNTYRQVYDLLLGRVPIPAGNVHRVRTELEPGEAAADYALELRKFAIAPFAWPRFDLVLLGMGSDGHTASLFPGSIEPQGAPVLAVTGQYEDRPAQRVTLSSEVFNSARTVMFLVSGKGKADVLKRVLYGASRPENLPGQRIHPPEGKVIWMVDRDAASLL